jgi:hypothetical protein
MILNAHILSFQWFVDGKVVASFSRVDGRKMSTSMNCVIQEITVSQ